MVFLAPWLAHLHNNKQLLISLQMIATLILVLGGTLLLSRAKLVLIGLLYLVLSSVNVISASVEVGFIQVVFQENEAAIEQSVDFQYFVSTGLTIEISVLSSAILLLPGRSTGLLIVSWFSAPLGIIFYWLISYDATMQPTDSEINQGPTTEQSYLRQMRSALYQFTHTMPAFLIILFEAILGGMTGLLLELLPLTMKEIGLAVALFSTVGAIQRVGDLIGGAVAPLVKWPAPTFFVVDYIISGGCFIDFTLPIPNVARLILLLVAGIGMGMSGNVFEKLMYRSYNVGDISAMHALATSTFVFFSVTSYIAAWIKVSTLILW
ncbi:hypothetical protein M3M39_01710 [Fructilactobacillus hinvesii]|uniref:Uncharacterized protein n=1 Tax=Fructilactobacillus hinvesii TaxID=2940300 RepID=A0ABY5BWV4_9LACO|nr:hypothetical protein [Fructilactobacillus hinvesii]USS88219.1 hypothetical protein M3M39_01710 [Fructilactobacillus hinvesii]